MQGCIFNRNIKWATSCEQLFTISTYQHAMKVECEQLIYSFVHYMEANIILDTGQKVLCTSDLYMLFIKRSVTKGK